MWYFSNFPSELLDVVITFRSYMQGGGSLLLSHICTHSEILESVDEMNINEFPDNL